MQLTAKKDPLVKLRDDIILLLQEHEITRSANSLDFDTIIEEVVKYGARHGPYNALADLKMALRKVPELHLAMMRSDNEGLALLRDNPCDMDTFDLVSSCASSGLKTEI